jgi:hypothetical protein
VFKLEFSLLGRTVKFEVNKKPIMSTENTSQQSQPEAKSSGNPATAVAPSAAAAPRQETSAQSDTESLSKGDLKKLFLKTCIPDGATEEQKEMFAEAGELLFESVGGVSLEDTLRENSRIIEDVAPIRNQAIRDALPARNMRHD